MRNKQKRKKIRGFTLIEIMVAVSIFSIVALIVSGAFITLANIFKKTQTNRAVVDNINLTMDTMTLQIREGRNHSYVSGNCDDLNGFNCANDISFDEYKIDEESGIYSKTRSLEYKIDVDEDGNGSVVQCVDGDSVCPTLTSSEVDIEKLNFYYNNSLIIVVMHGIAYGRDNLSTEFTLQTALSIRH